MLCFRARNETAAGVELRANTAPVRSVNYLDPCQGLRSYFRVGLRNVFKAAEVGRPRER